MTTLITNTAPAEGSSARHVTVLVDRCAGCQECVIRCPAGALTMEPVTWTALADDAACVGCRQCERVCPFSAIVVEGPLALTERYDPPLHHPVELRGNVEETRRGYDTWEEAIAEATRCLTCPDPTCVRGCPAHNDIPQFVAAVRDHDLDRAHEILHRTTVIPDVCSRVCNQAAQCEGACTWSLAGGVPVAIGRLERFIADHAPVPPPAAVAPYADALSVGIIGAGPAGLGAAWDLVEAGAHVTVYEREAQPGGLLLWGMPDFTLPDEVATRPWRQLVEAGVDLRCSTAIPADALDHLLTVHDAVVVANGAGVPIRLPVPGADLEGVVDATFFLQGAKDALMPGGDVPAWRERLGVADERGQRVLVLGAGNTAMDVARMARRLGLEATCVDWLDERFALARPDELAEARDEGVEVLFNRTLTSLSGEGRVARARLAHTVQRERTAQPTVLADQVDDRPVDLVVMAMGYRLDGAYREAVASAPIVKKAGTYPHGRWRASGLLANPASAYNHHNPVGSLSLDREVGLWAAASPRRERLWFAGDALTGPATVVEAMAQGRRAARAILDAQPARPDRVLGAAPAPRVLVAYASAGGTTRALAERLADLLGAAGARASVRSVTEVLPADLAHADALVLATWVEGMVVARVRAAAAMRSFVSGLGALGGRPVALAVTYGVNPRGVLRDLTAEIAAHGGVVVASESFGPRDRGTTRVRPSRLEAFANRVSAHVVRRIPVTSQA